MSTEAHKFKVGLFIIGAFLVGTGVLIWLGASKFFSETQLFVTYFAESVQGLEMGSPVKFMGVVAGSVSGIRIAPDGRMVEVRMDIDTEGFSKTEDMRAQLGMAGITGMKFIEITRSPESLPMEIKFRPRGEYIPAKASMFRDVMAAVKDVYDKVMVIDFQGISDEAKGSLRSINKRVGDPNLDRLMESLAKSAERLRVLLSKKETENIIVEAAATVGEMRELVHGLRTELEGSDIKGVFLQFQQTIYNFNLMIERVDSELAATVLNLRRATDNLARVAQRIDSDNPAQVLFGEPPPERIITENPVEEKRPMSSSPGP